MKLSYYTVSAPYGQQFVAYNVLHRSIVVLDKNEHDALLDVENCQNEELVKAFCDLHLVLENPEDEAEQIRYRQYRYRSNKAIFELTISPTRQCNCHCNYCYILKRDGFMSEEVQDVIMEFVEYNYAQAPFRQLKITWYGGEPLLGIDVIEALSKRFLAFCSEWGLEYRGHIITNGLLADEQMCKRLAEECGITSMMPTIGGMGSEHDLQRPALDGKPHFDELMSNIEAMTRAGIQVRANYVVNHHNYESCKKLAAKMSHKPGITTRLTRTFAYGNENMHFGDAEKTPIELFEEKEFGPYYSGFFRGQDPTVEEYEYILAPVPLYCAAWVHRNFFIDEQGEVFSCMIDMDYSVCSLFNLKDWRQDKGTVAWKRFLQFADLDPVNDARCRTCPVLPICQGGCAYGWLDGERACHDLKYCIEDVVVDYCKALEREERR